MIGSETQPKGRINSRWIIAEDNVSKSVTRDDTDATALGHDSPGHKSRWDEQPSNENSQSGLSDHHSMSRCFDPFPHSSYKIIDLNSTAASQSKSYK